MALTLKLDKGKYQSMILENQKERSSMVKWEKLEQLFYSKYPNGKIYRHGEMAGTDVAVIFCENGKVYNYKGNYQYIAEKLDLFK